MVSFAPNLFSILFYAIVTLYIHFYQLFNMLGTLFTVKETEWLHNMDILTQSLTVGHLGYFCFLITNNALINMVSTFISF